MKRALFVLFAFVPFFACRAVVGIEELSVDAGASASDADASRANDADAATADAGRFEGEIASCLAQPTTCRKCCKETFHELATFQTTAASCLCQTCAALCPHGCGAGNMQDPACPQCVDDQLVIGQCADQCKDDRCKAGLDCLRRCN